MSKFMELFDDMLMHGCNEDYIDKYLMNEFKKGCPRFEKVSFSQFCNDWLKNFPDDWDGSDPHDIHDIKTMYDALTLPTRSTAHSAGYDFVSPMYFTLKPGETIMIPTGIRAYMPHNMVLLIFPRSGLGTKYHMHLANSTGVVDSDYYNADNEGHIFIKMVNGGNDTVSIEQGQAFAQGVFTQYFVTHNDTSYKTRTGGLGSTN